MNKIKINLMMKNLTINQNKIYFQNQTIRKLYKKIIKKKIKKFKINNDLKFPIY